MTEYRDNNEEKITVETPEEVVERAAEEAKHVVSEEQLLSSTEHYSEEKFWNKLARYGKKAGAKVVYYALVLYYAMQSPDVSKTDKMLMIGALGYLILPLDVIPDFIPVVGFADDLGAIILALSKIGMAIDDNMKEQARAKMRDWFGQDFDSSEFDKGL